jgi:predicted MFS family arabinose efflux permease
MPIKKYLGFYDNLTSDYWQGAAFTLINAIATGISYFLALYFVNILHFSITAAGLLISTYSIGTVLGSMVSGKLADNYSPRIIAMIFILLQASSFYCLPQLQSFHWLLINMFFIGICAYGFSNANNIWLLQQSHQHAELRLKSVNLTRAASNLGMGLSGAIIGMIDLNHFHSLFLSISFILLLTGLYLGFFTKDTFHTQHQLNETNVAVPQHIKNNTIIYLMLFSVFLISFIVSQLSVTYPLFIQKTFPALGTKAVSILFVLDALLIVMFQVPLINKIKHINHLMLVAIGSLLMGIGMFILIAAYSFWVAILSCIIWTIGEMIFFGMAQFVCYEAGAPKKKGQTIGVFQAMSAASRVIGPALGGTIYHYFGASALWSLCFGLGVICFVVISANSYTPSHKRTV